VKVCRTPGPTICLFGFQQMLLFSFVSNLMITLWLQKQSIKKYKISAMEKKCYTKYFPTWWLLMKFMRFLLACQLNKSNDILCTHPFSLFMQVYSQCISKIGVKCQEYEVLLLQQNFWVGKYHCSKIHIFKHSVLWIYVILHVTGSFVLKIGILCK